MRVALAFVIAVSIVPAAHASAPALSGSTLLRAPEGGGAATVRVTADVGLPFIVEQEKTFAFTPDDRAAALALRRRGEGKPFFALVAYQPAPGLVPCVALDCESPLTWVQVSAGRSYDDRGVPKFRLPAGEYELHLVAEGGPAELKLSLPELGGDAGQLALTATHGSTVATLMEADGVGRIVGTAGTLPRPGARAIFLRSMSASSAVTRLEACVYDAQPQDAVPYGPGCPGAEDSFSATAAGTSQVGIGLTTYEAPAGRFGLGGNVLDASFFYGLAVSVPYPAARPEALAPPASAPPAPAPPAVTGGTIEILSTRARVRRGRLTLRLRCSGPARCRGVLRSARTRRAAFGVPAGATRSVRVRVRGRLRGTVVFEAIGAGGARATRRVRVTG